MKKSGDSEVTLSFKPPANTQGIQSYLISVTYVQASDDEAFLFERKYQKSLAADQSNVVVNETSAFQVVEDDGTPAPNSESWATSWKKAGKRNLHFGINVVRETVPGAPSSPSPRMVFQPSFVSLDDMQAVGGENADSGVVSGTDAKHNASRIGYFEL